MKPSKQVVVTEGGHRLEDEKEYLEVDAVTVDNTEDEWAQRDLNPDPLIMSQLL